MSPELLQKKAYDYTVDIWGLGILLYELMHGYSPFRAKKID
jgi:serine/threonine protein kinase